MFSGKNAPVAYALAWCGWNVEPIDWLINKNHDLSDLQVQATVASRMQECDAAIWAVDCSTLSRAREIAIPGHKHGPKPLRSEQLPRGLHDLQGRDKERVRQANLFIDFTFEQVESSVAAGKAAILESPGRSHLWNFEQLKQIRKTPAWQRTTYDACCWGGARKKQQAMESNVPELRRQLQASCHHIHAKDEWQPHEGPQGKWIYPSSGEAEYTADLAFSVAVALSWWAVRVGRAKLQVPRAPIVQDVGNRIGWPDLPPEVMRSWVMASTAVRLGLTPPAVAPGTWFPEWDTQAVTCWRRQVTQKMPAGEGSHRAVFVGQSEGTSRCPRTKWASPFVTGQHGTAAECFTKYVAWFHEQGQHDLRASLPELAGRELACECAPGQPCHADYLATQARTPPGKPALTVRRRGSPLPQLVMASLVVPAAAWYPGSGEVQQRWPQYGLDRAIRSLFPQEWTEGIAMPNLEDLVNTAPFTCYAEYLQGIEQEPDGPLGPTLITSYTRGQRRLAEGDQRGSFFAADAVGQVVPLGLNADEHFCAASKYAQQGRFPMNEGLAVESDLRCAADWTVARMANLADARTTCYKAVKALSERLQPLTAHLRKFQKGSVALVAGNMHVAFLAVAVILVQWPDTALPSRYITGFKSLGMLEHTGILRPVPRMEPVPLTEVLAKGPEAFNKLHGCRPTDESALFLIAECNKDLSKGFAGPLMTSQEADKKWGPGKWLPMPRFETVQASGKQRPIDDGKRFGHNSASGFTETIECCSAFQPVVHARALVEQATLQGQLPGLSQQTLETGGEDMPEAYRWVPAHPKEGALNVVAAWSVPDNCWMHQEIYGQVFGRAAAVINFHRIQRLLVAVIRRWLLVLVSMYYDDVTLQDLAAARGRGQRYVRALFRMAGLPLAEPKQVDLNMQSDFLGLTHDMEDSLRTGEVNFQPRVGLLVKAKALIEARLQEGSCTPAQASKIRGVLGFLFTGMYGRVGRGGQQPLLQRQYSDVPPWTLSNSLNNALVYLLDTLHMVQPRKVLLWGDGLPPLVIASDGRQDETRPPSIAALLYDPSNGQKVAVAAIVPPELLAEWGDSEHCIALIEQAALILGILRFKDLLRNRSVLWFEDNAAVLSGLVKGTSGHAQLDSGAACIHLLLAALGTRTWFEYVESDANWSDGASRLLTLDPWAKANGFDVEMGNVPTWPWVSQGVNRRNHVEQSLT